MKKIFTTFIILFNSNSAFAQQAYEIVFTKFKAEVSFEQQVSAMASLNDCVKTFKGFQSRNYYFDKDQQQWVDFVVWGSKQAAQNAAETVMQKPAAVAVFQLMDETQSLFGHYQKMGHIKK